MGGEWIAVADVTELPESRPYLIYPKGLSLILIRKDKAVYCISNTCAHMACPLADGALYEYALLCPCHEWAYDIRTGEFIAAPEVKIPTYETRIEKDKIEVRLS
jgi:nitrite reductase/ring-hydroxylating ferredoxin subunit